MIYDVIVVGGGAAGLWAAGTAALRGKRVLVLEKNNKAGVKILMSGGTRCNVTHACNSRQIAEAFGTGGRFLLSPLSRMPPEEVVRIFASLGVPTKVEETGKIFPISDKAIDVRDALLRRLNDAGGQILTGVAITNVQKSLDNGLFKIDSKDQTWQSTHVLITTGGLSFSGCGTTGDGYAWVQQMGHTVTPLRPALTPIVSSSQWVHELSGITLDDALVTAMPEGKQEKGRDAQLMQSRGGLLWTHFGCSGPTAMNVSKFFSDRTEYSKSVLAVDLLPSLSDIDCQNWIQQNSQGSTSQRQIATLLAEKVPKRMVATLLQQSGVNGETRIAELSKKHRSAIVDYLKAWRVPVHGTRGYPKAEVTAGGVDLKEVDSQTMQSKIVPGLFLAGEILNLDGPIGGFNFQSAWSTGHTAGENV